MKLSMNLALKLVGLAACVGSVCTPQTAEAHDPSNVKVGKDALKNNSGVENTAVGWHSMDPNFACTGAGAPNACCTDFTKGTCGNTGAENSALGAEALRSNTAGNSNTAAGSSALSFNSTGSYNTAVGSMALQDNDSGHDNTASGYQALVNNIDGASNTAVGSMALVFSPLEMAI